MQAVQAQLNQQGFNAGPEDGEWGSHTLTALRNWQQANNLPVTGMIDDQTWTQLLSVPVPDLLERALELTGDLEGTGSGGTNDNFDRQGITWGVVGFTWRNGELQDILKEIQTQHPAIFSQAFGALAGRMEQILKQPRSAQMDFALSISTNGGNAIEQSWATAFESLGNAPQAHSYD